MAGVVGGPLDGDRDRGAIDLGPLGAAGVGLVGGDLDLVLDGRGSLSDHPRARLVGGGDHLGLEVMGGAELRRADHVARGGADQGQVLVLGVVAVDGQGLRGDLVVGHLDADLAGAGGLPLQLERLVSGGAGPGVGAGCLEDCGAFEGHAHRAARDPAPVAVLGAEVADGAGHLAVPGDGGVGVVADDVATSLTGVLLRQGPDLRVLLDDVGGEGADLGRPGDVKVDVDEGGQGGARGGPVLVLVLRQQVGHLLGVEPDAGVLAVLLGLAVDDTDGGATRSEGAVGPSSMHQAGIADPSGLT